MTAQPPRSYTRLAIAVILAAVLVSATILLTLEGSSTVTQTKTQTNTVTTTVSRAATSTQSTCTIDGPSVFDCVTPSRVTEAFDFGSGAWNFTASVNATSVVRGQVILLTVTLTNTGGNETVNELVEPFIDPQIFAPNRTLLWQWNPPQATDWA